MSFDVDLFVIGGGSGGVRAARTAAATGAKVALAEKNRMGGTCVMRGCVPKKFMVFASTYRDSFEDARAYGWSVEADGFDWPSFRGKLETELDRLETVYQGMLDDSGVRWHADHASVEDPHTVKLASGGRITAKHILVATGGAPWVPDMPGGELCITSDDIFHLPELPKSILILGGGYIGCEFACILHGMGVEVTQFYRGAQVLNGFDDEARGLVASKMQDRGIRLHTGTNVVEMWREGNSGITVKATDGSVRTYDMVMCATGRRPNTEGLGLRELGVGVGRGGQVMVDEFSQTGIPSIYAIGDVTDRVALTPVAIREAMAFTETVFRGTPTPVDHDRIPSAVFTQPELGTVGLTEEAAAEREEVEVYCTSFRAMQQAFAGRDDRVLMKLVVGRSNREVLGCHIVAPQAGEMIQLAGVAVKMGATKDDFDRTVAVHPTMAEEIVTMRSPVRIV